MSAPKDSQRAATPAARANPLADGRAPKASETVKVATVAADPTVVSASIGMLPPRRQRFVREYLLDLNATQAAIRAGYSVASAANIGDELLSFPDVAAAVAAAEADRARRVQVKADDVLRELWTIAMADPSEIVELRRSCCRYCWGEGFRYQYTDAEWRRALAAHASAVEEARAKKGARVPTAPDPAGGVGFNGDRDPHEGCPECFGVGIARVVLHDTRHLSSSGRALFAGIKTTKDGIEIKLRDQDAALLNLGRHLGMFTDKAKNTLEVDGLKELREFLQARGSRLPIRED